MKLLEEIKIYDKVEIFEIYSRLIEGFKKYDKITKNKMIEEIFNFYSDYQNIINICTLKELKFLQKVINQENDLEDLKYEWELTNLRKKLLVGRYSLEIPEELFDNIKLVVLNYNLKEVKRNDEINEILVGICKVYGEVIPNVLIQIASPLLDLSFEEFTNHFATNNLFNYYVHYTNCDFQNKLTDVVFVYFDYFYLLNELREQRKKYGKAFSGEIDLDEKRTLYKNFFYNDFNTENKNVKKLLNILKKSNFYNAIKKELIRNRVLNEDIEVFIEASKSFLKLNQKELKEYDVLARESLLEIPSAAINGLTMKEYLELENKEIEFENEKLSRYQKQTNACLSKTSAKLFYKLFFALLEFTNKKYNINPNIKRIYKQEEINPNDIIEIIQKFWKEKDQIIQEFVLKNPYRLNKKELNLVKDMQKGIRDYFVIVDYQDEYTALVGRDKVYMIKGINSNIDEVIDINDLPYLVETTILPFKDCLIYDSLFLSAPISFGFNFKEMAIKQYKEFMKYYHL